MSVLGVLQAVFGNIARNRRSFVLSSVGLIIGVATLTFFVHLGMGIQEGVLNRIFPVNQIEIEPKTVGIVGLREEVVDRSRLGAGLVKEFEGLPDVTRVFPKLRSKFQARLWGGQALFGYPARTEAFFDGLEPGLVTAELAEAEDKSLKHSERKKRRRVESCRRDEECRLGEVCDLETGTCGDIEYWRRFRDHGLAMPCEGDEQCAAGLACVAGMCRQACAESACAAGDACVGPPEALACAKVCASDADCQIGESCEPGDGESTCQRLACALAQPEHQLIEDAVLARGRLTTRCANGVDPESPACEPLPCPGTSYCAPKNLLTADGYCEQPVPVILSPVLIELFNNAAATSLNMQKIDGLGAMLGVRFQLHLGDSYFAADLPKDQQVTKKAEIAGFSQKAMDFGVTMPISYVKALNARYKGRAAAETYDTFILETEGNEDVSELISLVGDYGMTLARRSEDARKAGDLLFILTVVFSFISLVILFVAGVNIMHTFLTLVTERRHEIGIMRAVGATRGDIRRLFLGEALVLGLFGGLVGNLVSFVGSRVVDWLAQEYLSGIPFKPDEFFAYDARVVIGGVAFACVFCLLGALIPSQRAARLDPAVVLAS